MYPFFLYACQHVLLFIFLTLSILTCVRWCLVVLICIFLMTNYAVHLFKYPLIFCISSLEKYLFSSFAHFLIDLFDFFAVELYELFYIFWILNLIRYWFVNSFSHSVCCFPFSWWFLLLCRSIFFGCILTCLFFILLLIR